MGWKGVLIFKDLYKFEPPIPLKDTFMKGSRAKGRCLHGYPLTFDQINSVLDKANETSVLKEIS